MPSYNLKNRYQTQVQESLAILLRVRLESVTSTLSDHIRVLDRQGTSSRVSGDITQSEITRPHESEF